VRPLLSLCKPVKPRSLLGIQHLEKLLFGSLKFGVKFRSDWLYQLSVPFLAVFDNFIDTLTLLRT
jgi:hypothetical protein